MKIRLKTAKCLTVLQSQVERHRSIGHDLTSDAETGFIDPFFAEPTVVVTCDVIEPSTGQGYERDPRSIARRAEEYLKSTGIGDTAFFGPEPNSSYLTK